MGICDGACSSVEEDEKLQDSHYRKAQIPCLTALSSCVEVNAVVYGMRVTYTAAIVDLRTGVMFMHCL